MWNSLWGYLGYEQNDDHVVPHSAPQFTPIPASLRTAVSGGVRFNLKIVIRGARKTGKTALLQRLQGKPLPAQYEPSPAISTATISWRPQPGPSTTTETVKVEVWDVVDKGSAVRTQGTSSKKTIKDAPSTLPSELPPLDSSVVDVYQQCQCAIFMIDVTRGETLDYVLFEGQKVPRHVCILVCLNFADQSSRAVVSAEMVEHRCGAVLNRAVTPFVASLTLGKAELGYTAPVCFIETSMITNFGLRPLHAYLNIPLAMLRIQTLEDVLDREYSGLRKKVNELKEIRERQSLVDHSKQGGMLAEEHRVSVPATAPSGATTAAVEQPTIDNVMSDCAPTDQYHSFFEDGPQGEAQDAVSMVDSEKPVVAVEGRGEEDLDAIQKRYTLKPGSAPSIPEVVPEAPPPKKSEKSSRRREVDSSVAE